MSDVPSGWSPDVFEYLPLCGKVQRPTICSASIQSRGEKYPLCKTRTSETTVFGHLLLVYFLFLTAPFYVVTNRIFLIGTALDLPSTVFCFCVTRVCL